MKSNVYSTCVAFLLTLCHTGISQTSFLDCIDSLIRRCVNDPGISLPDSNQLLIGLNTPGAVSCGVHVTQARTITSTCIGSLNYYVALVVGDSVQAILQPPRTVYVDFSNRATLSFDTRAASSALIRKNGLLYNEGCGDVHRIRWVVTDQCGNEVVCEERMQLYDCQEPVIKAHDQPVHLFLSAACSISAKAKNMVDEIIDDCIAPDSFRYSFVQDRYKPDTFFYCDIINDLGVELPWEIWIADAGHDNNCNGEIAWDERNLRHQPITIVYRDNGSCHCGMWDWGHLVSGIIYTSHGKPIEKTAVNLTAPGKVFPTYITSQHGEYQFSDVFLPDNYEIRAERNDNHRNGVSTLDLLKIQRHLLGIEPLSSPYDIIAADANNSQNVSLIDLVELRKLILGIYTTLPSNKSWRFVDQGFHFANPANPWPFDEIINFNALSDNTDFIAVKIGDVNNTARGVEIESPFQHARPTITFVTEQQRYVRGEEIEIPIRISHDDAILGFQFTMDSDDLKFTGATTTTVLNQGPHSFTPVIIQDWDTHEEKLTMLWFDTTAVAFNVSDTLFTIHARALQDGYLRESLFITSDITEAEVYDAEEKIFTPILKITGSGRQAYLLPPSPNPWQQNTTIAFHLEAPVEVLLTITDINKNMLWQKRVDGYAGRNEVTIHADDVQGAGLLFCSMVVDGEVQYQKMMLIR